MLARVIFDQLIEDINVPMWFGVLTLGTLPPVRATKTRAQQPQSADGTAPVPRLSRHLQTSRRNRQLHRLTQNTQQHHHTALAVRHLIDRIQTNEGNIANH